MSAAGISDVTVPLSGRPYSISIGAQLLEKPSTYQCLRRGSSAVIVSNETVGPLYASSLTRAIEAHYSKTHVVLVADGEAHKTWQTLQTIFDAMLAARCDRSTTVFALGGGVVGDLAGFAAACYMRGVDYVQVPTTLLAQVDSSVGGKTGINHPTGKNMIGAFHQPIAVVADVAVLDTLPDRELVAGVAEVIKYGVIVDDEFLAWIESSLPALLGRDREALIHAVTRSCQLKASFVGADERESGVRAVLNFGHTFGHAIETGTGHGTWLHGEAVGCGMAMAADLSVRLGLIEPAHADRIVRIVTAAGLPVKAPPLAVDRYLELMRMDKKAAAGELRLIVLEGPGRASVRAVDEAAVAATIERFSR